MRTNVKYFSSLTVPALRERLAVIGVKGVSKSRKNELVGAIVCLLDGAHLDAEVVAQDMRIEALAQQDIDNEQAEAEFQALMSDARGEYAVQRMERRVEGYLRQNGSTKLTAPQQRRINKNARKYSIFPWHMAYGLAV